MNTGILQRYKENDMSPINSIGLETMPAIGMSLLIIMTNAKPRNIGVMKKDIPKNCTVADDIAVDEQTMNITEIKRVMLLYLFINAFISLKPSVFVRSHIERPT